MKSSKSPASKTLRTQFKKTNNMSHPQATQSANSIPYKSLASVESNPLQTYSTSSTVFKNNASNSTPLKPSPHGKL